MNPRYGYLVRLLEVFDVVLQTCPCAHSGPGFHVTLSHRVGLPVHVRATCTDEIILVECTALQT
jgi:hypothetical protein